MTWRWVLYPPFTEEHWERGSDDAITSAESALKTTAAAEAACRQHDASLAAWTQAYEARIAAEAHLACIRGEEYAVELKDVPRMDAGAPMPWIVASEHGASILYFARRPTSIEPPLERAFGEGDVAVPLSADAPQWFVLVRCEGAVDVHFSGPNDEALHMHRLHGRGLRAYAVHEVGNSRWAAVTWNYHASVGDVLPPERRSRHFVITFHDSMVELLARNLTSQLVEGRWDEMRRLACGPLPQAPMHIRPDLVWTPPPAGDDA